MIRVISVNMQIYKVLTFLLLEIWRQKVTPLQKETSRRNSIITPWNRPKFEEHHFLWLKTPFLAKSYTPYAFSCSIFRDVIFKNTCSNPTLVNQSCQNCAKMRLIDKLKVTKFGSAKLSRFRVTVNNLMVWAKKPPSPVAYRVKQ